MQQSEKRPPNVVMFLADDLGFGDIGCHGNHDVRTVHIDRFSAESAEIGRFYVSPVCAPTRASLLTGRWNFRTGVTDVFGDACNMVETETTLAEDLQQAGYATGLFGKWHLGDKGVHRATQRGFDEVLTFEGPSMRKDQYFNPILLHNDRPEQWSGYCMDIFVDAAIDFIRRNRSRSFFLYLPANLIHVPMAAPDELLARYDNLGLFESTRSIYAMIQSLDENFGRLRAALSELGLEDNTLLCATSDNGPCSGSNPVQRHMAGLHGLKGTVYENGVRVPCYMRWPEGFKTKGVIPQVGAHIDLRPTFLDAVGCEPADGSAPIDGRSLLPALAGSSDDGEDERSLFFQWDSNDTPLPGKAYCVIRNRWKLVQPCGMDATVQKHIRDRYTELCALQDRGDRSIEGPDRFELYDLEHDPGERNDVAADHPELVEELRGEYDAWFDDVTRGFERPRRT